MPQIDHVVVLMLENRSFDHMLGYLDHPNAEFDGLRRGGPYTNPGWHGEEVPTRPEAKRVLPVGPDHSHEAVMEQLALTGRGAARRATNRGFVRSYERKGRGLAPPRFGGALGPLVNWYVRRAAAKTTPVLGRGPLVMLCQPPEQVPVLARLALDFAVCTRWFCSVPGETWPNRNFAHAGTSDGETEITLRPYLNRTIFELLEEDAGATWHVYHDDTPQLWAFPRLWDTPDRHANWYPYADFLDHARAGALPAYSFIEPNHRPPLHTLDRDPVIGVPALSTSQHPDNNRVSDDAYDAFPADADTDFARAESLVASTYEALRSAPEAFERTLLLITYDEHGGLYDHVPPPTGVPSPGRPRPGGAIPRAIYHRVSDAFDFTMLGARVPAVVVSPYIAAGTVDNVVRDHASIPATLRALFAPNAEPLTARDAWSPPFHSTLTLSEPRRADLPDLSGYVHQAAAAARTARASAEEEQAAASDALAAADVPDFYHHFVAEADRVRTRLIDVGEPEIAAVSAASALQRSAETSEAFTVAAQRHRAATERVSG